MDNLPVFIYIRGHAQGSSSDCMVQRILSMMPPLKTEIEISDSEQNSEFVDINALNVI